MLQNNKTISKILIILLLIFSFIVFGSKKVYAYDYNTVLSDLESLESLAEQYKQETGTGTDTKILISSYIRNGVYDSTWNQYGTTIDSNFDSFVNDRNSSLSYLKSVFTITTSSGDTIDFKRLVSDLDIMYTRGSLFGSWVSDIYDLTMVVSSSQNTADSIASSYYNSFSSSGCLTNIDAFNIYKRGGWSISSNIRDYYSSLSGNNRYKQFTNNLGVSQITKDALRVSVLTNFRNCSEIVNLLGLKGISFDNNRNVVEGACYAFADFIFERHPDKQYNTSLQINEKDFTMTPGEEAELTITIEPKVDSSLLTLTSSAPDVVSIVSGTTIKAISAGEAVISCSYQGSTGSVKVTVLSKIEKITFSESKIKIQAGAADRLEPIVTPSGNIKYSFKSSDISVVDVDQAGNIYSLKAGKATVYCISNENPEIRAEIEIEVVQSIQSLEFAEEEISLRKGESRKVKLVTEPENYTDELIYSSSDSQIASVDSTGTITARKEGEAIISCYPDSNPELVVNCKVVVTKGIEKLEFSPSFKSIDLKDGNQYKLTLISVPVDIDISSLNFEISDKNMISLNTKTMTITVQGHGAASITVRSKEDPDISARMNIYVLNTGEEEPTKTVNKDKDAEIEVEDIVDKADEMVSNKPDTKFFDIDLQKTLLMIVVISIILVIVAYIVVEIINKNKNKLGKNLGFKENFEEDRYDLEEDWEAELKSTKNVFKIHYQTEKAAQKLAEQLEKEYEERLEKERLEKEELEKQEKEMKESILDVDRDLELLYFDKQMEEQRSKEIEELLRKEGYEKPIDYPFEETNNNTKEIKQSEETLETIENINENNTDTEDIVYESPEEERIQPPKEKKEDMEFFSAEELRNELRDSLKNKKKK